MKRILIITCFVYCVHSFAASADISLLRSKLLKDYKKGARPVRNHNSNTTVKFGISLLNVNLNDHDQLMEVSSILHVSWNDEFLRWDEQVEGVDRLHFDRDEIWIPDVALFNSARGSNISPKSSVPLLALSTGVVMWLPPFNGEVPCQINLFMWPQDANTCTFRFGSWAHHGEQLDLQPAERPTEAISLSKYEKSNKWKLLNCSSQKELTKFDGDKFVYIDFKITVQREASAHVAYVTHTAMAVMMCILSSYLLPLKFHLSRLIIHLFGLSVLIFCDMVLYLSLPVTGGPVPHIVRYYSGTIILTTMSLICNAVMVTTLTMKPSSKVTGEVERRPTYGSSLEINYVVLEEELSEIPQQRRNSVRENNQELPDQPHVPETESTRQSSTLPASSRALGSKEGLHKALNILFLGMYSVAYIIDYMVMRSTISR